MRLLARLGKRALSPVERFLAIEAASGLVLLAAAACALVWANSPWRASYAALWQTPFGVQRGGFVFRNDLRFFVNDGLMAIFFFVAGLEIRRETQHGELASARRAALPLVAALGGMIVPACIFLAMNPSGNARRGWGIPIATDIAFAVGVLSLLGKRVPPALRTLLLALAVIDDVGAIAVMALFYSGLEAHGLVLLAVALGLALPPRAWVDRMRRALDGWVAFGILPIFALANAGVWLGDAELSGEPLSVFVGIVAGLVIGKPLGVLGFSWLATRLGAAALPSGVTWPELGLVGIVAGIGFTMSIFIAQLAFAPGAALETSKLGVLVASGVAALAALGVGQLVLRRRASEPRTQVNP